MKKTQLRPAVSAFLLMVSMSLLSTALSFFVEPVCQDLGFGRGTFTLYYSLMTATGAFATSFLGQYMNKHGVRNIILISALWCGIGFIGLSLSQALWMFYIVGAAMGFFGTSCVYLCANITVQKSYPAQNASLIMGFVMAGSGIGGVVWSNLVPNIIDNFGWQFSYRILGLCWFILSILSFLILGKQELSDTTTKSQSSIAGTSKKDALRSIQFYLVVAVMCMITICSCISQQLPSLLSGMGYDGTQVGIMMSIMTASIAVGSILEGTLCCKFGIAKTIISMLVVYAIGYGMLFSKAFTYPALVGLAFGSGTIGTLMPVVVMHIFGGRDYAAIWSLVITCSSITSFIATPVWGMIYDIFGNYVPALITMPILLTIAIVCLIIAFRKHKEQLHLYS